MTNDQLPIKNYELPKGLPPLAPPKEGYGDSSPSSILNSSLLIRNSLPSSLILFGDSYAAGRLPQSHTDGALKAALLSLAPSLDITDLALSGSTAADWARPGGSCHDRLQRAAARSGAIAVGSLGGNDLFRALSDGRVTLAEASSWLRDVLSAATQLAMSLPTWLMIYPCPPFLRGVKLASLTRDALALSLRGAAHVAGARTIDLAPVLTDASCWDGPDIHPSQTGYLAIARLILAATPLGDTPSQPR